MPQIIMIIFVCLLHAFRKLYIYISGQNKLNQTHKICNISVTM